jgi:hypothetical protein
MKQYAHVEFRNELIDIHPLEWSKRILISGPPCEEVALVWSMEITREQYEEYKEYFK